jgi:hypothetical protein
MIQEILFGEMILKIKSLTRIKMETLSPESMCLLNTCSRKRIPLQILYKDKDAIQCKKEEFNIAKSLEDLRQQIMLKPMEINRNKPEIQNKHEVQNKPEMKKVPIPKQDKEQNIDELLFGPIDW